MPIYGFECTDCGHRYDRLQKLSDPDPTNCPACQSEAVRRQISAPAFRLAGSGWYETDFKKEGDRKRNLADSGEPAKAEAAKPEVSKPEAAKAEPAAAKPAVSEAKPAAPAAS